jgi:hypothetical protein
LEAQCAQNQWFYALRQNGGLFSRPLGTTSEEMLAEISLETKNAKLSETTGSEHFARTGWDFDPPF